MFFQNFEKKYKNHVKMQCFSKKSTLATVFGSQKWIFRFME